VAAREPSHGRRADRRRTVDVREGLSLSRRAPAASPWSPRDLARVVHMQHAIVAQLQFAFRHAQPPVPGTDREDPHPLSLCLRDADATGAQIVYGIPHPLPRIIRDPPAPNSRREDAAASYDVA